MLHCRRLVAGALLAVYLALLVFALFNYKSHCVFTHPETLLIPKAGQEHCHVDLNSLGNAKVDIFTEPVMELIEENNPQVKKGGKVEPEGCRSHQHVAIIIPYRDRLHHLKILLNRLHPMLLTQKVHYQVFLIEQGGTDKFNRGKLMNVGYLEALKLHKFDCFVFHDVDLIPENDKNLYLCDQNARHLSSAIDEMRYHVMYYNYAGGVIALNRESFRRINGYSNSYWGWGNEDDDLSARIQESGLMLTRPPEHIGRFKMVRHHKQSRSENGNEQFFYWRQRWPRDGLNDPQGMWYNVSAVVEHPLYTSIIVDLGRPPTNNMAGLDPSKRESVWWFLKFYYP